MGSWALQGSMWARGGRGARPMPTVTKAVKRAAGRASLGIEEQRACGKGGEGGAGVEATEGAECLDKGKGGEDELSGQRGGELVSAELHEGRGCAEGVGVRVKGGRECVREMESEEGVDGGDEEQAFGRCGLLVVGAGECGWLGKVSLQVRGEAG